MKVLEANKNYSVKVELQANETLFDCIDLLKEVKEVYFSIGNGYHSIFINAHGQPSYKKWWGSAECDTTSASTWEQLKWKLKQKENSD